MAWKYDRTRAAQPILLLCICHSDLLKELKNPVHGDRNKADDVSWPFYSAIDEVLGHGRRTPNNDEYIDPHEFLCVSVTPEEPTSSVDTLPAGSNPEDDNRRESTLLPAQKLRSFNNPYLTGIDTASQTQQSTRQTSKNPRRKRDAGRTLISRLPRATEISIEKVPSQPDSSKDLSRSRGSDIVDSTKNKGQVTKRRSEDEESPRKSRRTRARYHEDHESRIDRYIQEIFEYTKKRDEENRSIMTRIMHAVETIANKL